MGNLKWQIHAETSISQAAMWLVIGKLYGGWVWIPAVIFIFGNIFTSIKATRRLPKKYFSTPTTTGGKIDEG